MVVLALDTTGADCSVSLVNDAQVLGHISEPMTRGHAERLAPMVAEVFDRAGLSPKDVDRLAVCTGPGGFTGLRVALSFAKGFALPRSLPILGFDALYLTARALDPAGTHSVAVRRDIRRGEFFYALYDQGNPQHPPRVMSQEEMGWHARDQWVKQIHDARVDTRILGFLAHDADPADHPAEALYSRGPDAKLPKARPA